MLLDGPGATTRGSIVTSGGVQALTLPIRLTATRDVATPGDTVLTFEGQFVATRVVPEPGLGAAVAGAVMLLRRRR